MDAQVTNYMYVPGANERQLLLKINTKTWVASVRV